MLKRKILLTLSAVVCLLPIVSEHSGAAGTRADEASDFVPLGAYLSWELIDNCAKHSAIDRWDDLSRRLDLCVENHINTLWVTNMSEADLPRLITECERRKLKLLVMMSSIDSKVTWRWQEGGKYYETKVPELVKLAGGSESLVGWILTDEPRDSDFSNIETLRKMFSKADPGRFCTVVSKVGNTIQVMQAINFPVVSTEIYPFFGPDDLNGPHTDRTSINYFRKHLERIVNPAVEKNVVLWVMVQCFTDVWGPYEYNGEGHIIALPGSYLHWRCPTAAEIQWQIWETLRSQAKGVLFYEICPILPSDTNASKKHSSDASLKQILIKEPVDAGPGALITIDGKATPQLREVGKAFSVIAPHASVIRRWKATATPLVKANTPAAVQTFVDPAKERTYAVVVNDDLHQSQVIALIFETGTKAVVDVARGDKEIKLANGKGSIELKPGEGTILAIIGQ